MRHITVVLIALMALCMFTSTSWALQPFLLSLSNDTQPKAVNPAAEASALTTPSIASFLSDSWVPSSFEPPVFTAQAVNKEGYLANTTNAIYDFLNEAWTDGGVATQNIYPSNEVGYLGQFLNPDYNPSTAVELERPAPDYKKHVMS